MPAKNVINILMADDDQDDCYFFERALKKIEIPTTLLTLDDGEQLMDYLVKTKENPPTSFSSTSICPAKMAMNAFRK